MHLKNNETSCTENCELKGVQDAWLSPKGEFHPVGIWEHSWYAVDVLCPKHGARYVTDLTDLGWVRLSANQWRSRCITQAQLDVIFDWHVANGRKFEAELYEVE